MEHGWKHPFYLQEIKRLLTLIHKAIDPKSQTGKIMISSLEMLKVDVGVDFDFRTSSSKVLISYVPSCWFSSLLRFTDDQNVDLIGSFGSIPFLREGDICLIT